jgi:hypothetical protein
MSSKDVSGRRLDLARALGDAGRAVPRAWSLAWGALVGAAVVAAAPALGWPGGGAMGLLWGLLTALTALVLAGALFRIGVGEDAAGARALGLQPAGLQFGRPELRLLGALLLVLIFLAMIGCVLALVVVAVAGMAELDVAAIQARRWGEVGETWKLAVLGLIGLIAVAVPLLLTVRLSLFAPATLGRRGVVSLNSMGVAYGSFWPLLAGLVTTAAPTLVLAALAVAGALKGTAAGLAWPLVLVGLQAPLTAGFLSAAYRQLEYWKG